MAQQTYPSLPAIAVGLKDTEVISAEFVYNFFMADERITETSAVSPSDNTTDQASFASNIGKLPRYIELKFSETYGGTSKDIKISNLVANGAQIVYEDAPFNTNLSSIVVADTLADSRAYLIASASSMYDMSIIDNSTGDENPRFSAVGSRGIESEKSLMFDSLHNIQAVGYKYAETDANRLVRDQFLGNVKGFSSGLSLNNLFIGDITENILQNENSIFADEFAAARSRSSYIQGVSRENTTPYRISSSTYDQTLPYYTYVNIKADSSLSKSNITTSVSHVGFIIEKFGQDVDGTATIYDSIYIDNPKITSYIDPRVRYGGLYSYTLRSVYEVTIPVSSETSSGKPVGSVLAKILIATTGKNIDVFCEESVPPPPPEDVFFNFMPTGELFIGWQFPLNKQRDIKKFQIFRRKTIKEPFELLQEIDFDDSVVKTPNIENIPADRITYKSAPTCFYVDQGFNVNSKYIYAIVSVDAHGYTSNYSTQFEVRVNIFTETLIIKDVVRKGCPKPYPNLLLEQDFFVDLLKDSGHTHMKVYFNPDYTDMVGEHNKRVGVISYNNKQPTYKIHILETNLAQDQMLEITLRNEKIAVSIPISEAKVYTQVR